jgi:hypothetical protein
MKEWSLLRQTGIVSWAYEEAEEHQNILCGDLSYDAPNEAHFS